MASQIDICNEALVLAGELPIDDIDDADDPKAVKVKTFWETTRDELLQVHPWGFAIKRVQLQQDATEPVFGYIYAYTLPSDCLRVLIATPNESELDLDENVQASYRVEYGRVLTEEETLYLKYVSRVFEPGRFSPLFCSAFAARIASKLAGALTKSGAAMQAMMQLAELRLREARSADMREGGITVFQRSSWKDARNG